MQQEKLKIFVGCKMLTPKSSKGNSPHSIISKLFNNHNQHTSAHVGSCCWY